MTTPFSIATDTGNIHIGDVVILLPFQERVAVERQIDGLCVSEQVYENGYTWLTLRNLTFGRQPASLALCFHDGRLGQASWSVQLPNAELEDNWPTRAAIDAEVAFVRKALAEDMNINAGSMAWGEVWSDFDAKGFLAANGLRYSPPPSR